MATSVKPSQPPINEDFLRRFYEDLVSEGEPGFFIELIDRFFISAPARLEVLRAAVRQKNVEAIRRESHSLKNIVMNVGGFALGEVSMELEELANTGHVESADLLLAKAEAEMERLLPALRRKRAEFCDGN